MVTKLVNRPLGIGNAYAPNKKEWIEEAIGAAGGLVSSLFGGLASSSAMKEAERRQRQQESKENAWYNRRYYEDYVDTAAGQNLVRRAKEFAKSQWKKASGAQAVAGGTDASAAMAKEAGNKMMGDTIADIAAADQARKTRVDELHRQAEAQFAQQDINREINRANNIKEAAQGASNAIFSAAGGIVDELSTGASKTPTPITGASNNSKVVTSPKVADNAGQTTTQSKVADNAITKAADDAGQTVTDAENEHFRRAVGA